MSTTRKIAIGIGLAGSALLAAYLLTGNRKKKTHEFISKTGRKLKDVMEAGKRRVEDDHEVDYV